MRKEHYDKEVQHKNGKKLKNSIRYINLSYLKALGAHCKKIRIKKGFSIDRMAKESEQLSTSVIHRLETASGSVTINSLLRYAEVLAIPVQDLFEFSPPPERLIESKSISKISLLSLDSLRIEKEAYRTLLPLYSLKAAAGYFGDGKEVEPEAWVEVRQLKKIDKKFFIAQAKGNSMEPLIYNGDYLVFRADPEGTRQGKIVLAQYRGPSDPDTGGSYTVKKYSSTKIISGEGWRHREITLSPMNPEYESLRIQADQENDFRIIAEFILNLGA